MGTYRTDIDKRNNNISIDIDSGKQPQQINVESKEYDVTIARLGPQGPRGRAAGPWQRGVNYCHGEIVTYKDRVFVRTDILYESSEFDNTTAPDVGHDIWILSRGLANVDIYVEDRAYYKGDLVISNNDDEDISLFRFVGTNGSTDHVAPTSREADGVHNWQEIGGGQGTPATSGRNDLKLTVTVDNIQDTDGINPIRIEGQSLPATDSDGDDIVYTLIYKVEEETTANSAGNTQIEDIELADYEIFSSVDNDVPTLAFNQTDDTEPEDIKNELVLTFSGNQLSTTREYTLGFRANYRDNEDEDPHHEDFVVTIEVHIPWYTEVSTTQPNQLPSVSQGVFHKGDEFDITIPATDPETYTAYAWLPTTEVAEAEFETIGKFNVDLEFEQLTLDAWTSGTDYSTGHIVTYNSKTYERTSTAYDTTNTNTQTPDTTNSTLWDEIEFDYTLISFGSFPVGGTQKVKITEA